jgi:hypothetical protein
MPLPPGQNPALETSWEYASRVTGSAPGHSRALDPDFNGLMERCCEWIERDIVQYDFD